MSEKKLGITKEEAEKIILNMQDLIMKVAQYVGLDSYEITESIKNFAAIKNNIKYKIENALNYSEDDIPKEVDKKVDGTKYIKLNLDSKKKYSF